MKWEYVAGPNTSDKVYLLSAVEFSQYFGNDEQVDCWSRSPYNDTLNGKNWAVAKGYDDRDTDTHGVCPVVWVNMDAFPYSDTDYLIEIAPRSADDATQSAQ